MEVRLATDAIGGRMFLIFSARSFGDHIGLIDFAGQKRSVNQSKIGVWRQLRQFLAGMHSDACPGRIAAAATVLRPRV
jgi:hypothetical protein